MIHPTLRTSLVFLAGSGFGLLPTLADARLWPLAMAYLFVAGALVVIDATLIPGQDTLDWEIASPDQILIGTSGQLEIRLRRRSARWPMGVEVLVDMDEDLERQSPRMAEFAAGSREAGELTFSLRPLRRGELVLEQLWLRWSGPLGLVRRVHSLPLKRKVSVLPDIRGARTAAIRFFGSRRAHAGLKTERFLGDGSEFESLLRYTPGLDTRSIDWKASARHTRLLCRQFRAERNHQVVLAIDTGRLMSEPLEQIPRVDHAIEGALTLAFIGLHTGDQVGLFTFDAEARNWVAPRAGARSFPGLREETSRIEYSHLETNYTLAMLELGMRLKRRSLVVVFTEFTDSIAAELMVESLHRLNRRHMVVFLALRDPLLEQLRSARPDLPADIDRAVIAEGIERERQSVLRRLRQGGVWCIDVRPGEVSAELLNHYLEIRRREAV